MAPNRNPLLEAAAADIVKRLGGDWSSGGAMCRCPAHADKSPSLSVRIGDRSLLFKCFAGCDTLDVLREIRRMRLGVPTDPNTARAGPSDYGSSPMVGRALDIWEAAVPISGTVAERYLATRHLEMWPNVLRFHPRTPLGRGRAVQFRPALIAAIHERGRLVAIQRGFLDSRDSCLARDLEKPKRTLARPLGGAVMLSRHGPILGLAEGVETAMSAAILLGIPVWAALGSERLHQITIPNEVTRIILLPDNDAAGRAAVPRAKAAYRARNLAVGLEWPWDGRNDWNDVLRLGGKREGDRVRLAA